VSRISCSPTRSRRLLTNIAEQGSLAVGTDSIAAVQHQAVRSIYLSQVPGQHTVAAEDEARALVAAKNQLAAAGFPIDVLSRGSSPSATATVANGNTEIRPGVYVFSDAQQLELGRIIDTWQVGARGMNT